MSTSYRVESARHSNFIGLSYIPFYSIGLLPYKKNVMFLLNNFLFIFKTLFNVCTAPVADFMYFICIIFLFKYMRKLI